MFKLLSTQKYKNLSGFKYSNINNQDVTVQNFSIESPMSMEIRETIEISKITYLDTADVWFIRANTILVEAKYKYMDAIISRMNIGLKYPRIQKIAHDEPNISGTVYINCLPIDNKAGHPQEENVCIKGEILFDGRSPDFY